MLKDLFNIEPHMYANYKWTWRCKLTYEYSNQPTYLSYLSVYPTHSTGSKYDQNTTVLAAQSPLSPTPTGNNLDENHNNQKRPLSPRSASLVHNCTHLQEHPEFTGTPLVFNTSSTPYMEAGLQGSLTAQAGSIIRQRSSRVNRGLRVDQPFAQRRSVVRSPYAMGGHTPLILMTFLDK